MKNKGRKLKVLLDTSFILPTLGIDVEEEIIKTLERIENIDVEIYFSTFSVLETLWTAIRLLKKLTFDEKSFRQGLKSIMRSGKYMLVVENDDIFYEALNLYRMGHRDIIDNILYMDSRYFNLKLLTVDKDLRSFIRSKGLKDILIFPSELNI